MGSINTTIEGPKLDKAVIPHYSCTSIPFYILKQKVSINEKYLKEKSTWYMIEDKLKYFKASKVYDSERILGLDHRNILIYIPNMTWSPLFPYENELLFETQEQAQKTSIEMYDGLDPNLTELYINFSKEAKPYLERLAYDYEYRKILERFSTDTSQIQLLPQTQEYFKNVLEERKKEFQKVLKLKKFSFFIQ